MAEVRDTQSSLGMVSLATRYDVNIRLEIDEQAIYYYSANIITVSIR